MIAVAPHTFWRHSITRAAVSVVACAVLGGGLIAQRAAASDRIDYERIADEAVASVRFMRLQDWEALDDRTIVLWAGRQEPYLVKLDGNCIGLTFNNTIGVTSVGHRLFAGHDRVLTANSNCRITSIQPLDYGKLQAAKKEMRKDGGRDVLVRERSDVANGIRENGVTPGMTVSVEKSK